MERKKKTRNDVNMFCYLQVSEIVLSCLRCGEHISASLSQILSSLISVITNLTAWKHTSRIFSNYLYLKVCPEIPIHSKERGRNSNKLASKWHLATSCTQKQHKPFLILAQNIWPLHSGNLTHNKFSSSHILKTPFSANFWKCEKTKKMMSVLYHFQLLP